MFSIFLQKKSQIFFSNGHLMKRNQNLTLTHCIQHLERCLSKRVFKTYFYTKLKFVNHPDQQTFLFFFSEICWNSLKNSNQTYTVLMNPQSLSCNLSEAAQTVQVKSTFLTSYVGLKLLLQQFAFLLFDPQRIFKSINNLSMIWAQSQQLLLILVA